MSFAIIEAVRVFIIFMRIVLDSQRTVTVSQSRTIRVKISLIIKKQRSSSSLLKLVPLYLRIRLTSHREESLLSKFNILGIIIHHSIFIAKSNFPSTTGIGIENRMHTAGTTFGAKS